MAWQMIGYGILAFGFIGFVFAFINGAGKQNKAYDKAVEDEAANL